MPPFLVEYITQYGYLTLFVLVFVQEIGIPLPVPNEITLLFAGSLAAVGSLDITLILLTVVSADFIGTSLLYWVFYLFGYRILNHKPKWIPLPQEKLQKITQLVSEKERWGIYIGRLLPYVRGYTSVIAGLLQMRPKIYLPAVLFSAITWSGGYAFAGKLLGTQWQSYAEQYGPFKTSLFLAAAVIFFLWFIRVAVRTTKKFLAERRTPPSAI